MIIILLFVFSCEKDKPTEPDEPPENDHEQGEVENYSVLYDDQGNIFINGVNYGKYNPEIGKFIDTVTGYPIDDTLSGNIDVVNPINCLKR